MQTTPENLQDETKTKLPLKFASLSALTDSAEAKMDTSNDDSDTERPRKKRAMGLDGPQGTTPISLSCPPAPRWSDLDPYTALPPPSEPTNKMVDVVKLIRKARLDDAAKADETDEFREKLDFISLGVISESEPQSNAPENTSDIAPKG
ncbi:PAP/25A-associated [Penicillium canescens]|nr:PAP/25A-associated [Penicillium canescens]